VLDKQPLTGWQFKDSVAAGFHPSILGQLLGNIPGPAIVVEYDGAAGRHSIEEHLQSSNLRL
jgi:hypothetical protein